MEQALSRDVNRRAGAGRCIEKRVDDKADTQHCDDDKDQEDTCSALVEAAFACVGARDSAIAGAGALQVHSTHGMTRNQ